MINDSYRYILDVYSSSGVLIMKIGSVFENNKTQAVRLPVETRFDKGVKKVSVRVLGNARILEPLHQDWNSFFDPEKEGVSDDFIETRASQSQSERESFDD